MLLNSALLALNFSRATIHHMKLEIELHEAQGKILKTLLLNPKARFSDLNKNTDLSSDHFSFHIKRLLDVGLLEKSTDGDYSLTTVGKEFANRIDTDTTQIERQAKVSINIGCIREVNGKREYLIQQRLKNPYFGYWGFVGGKIKWGETVFEAAARELEEETGLQGEFRLVGVKHKMDYDDKENILEDKFFFVVTAFNLSGDLKEKFEGGQNKWMTKEEFYSIENLFDGVADTIKLHEQENFEFVEKKFVVKGY
jgi:ADP-ribose pyrophosphatase YjhB (NUDIX family)/predicted transcriptional regulator